MHALCWPHQCAHQTSPGMYLSLELRTHLFCWACLNRCWFIQTSYIPNVGLSFLVVWKECGGMVFRGRAPPSIRELEPCSVHLLFDSHKALIVSHVIISARDSTFLYSWYDRHQPSDRSSWFSFLRFCAFIRPSPDELYYLFQKDSIRASRTTQMFIVSTSHWILGREIQMISSPHWITYFSLRVFRC